MRQMTLNRDDFEMFHQDISPMDYEFFRTHVDTFKRMWREQTRRFWALFLSTFERFIWTHGCVKDFPMKSKEISGYIDEIVDYIRQQFVYGKVSTAKKLINDCVIVTQNRHCITILDRATYAQNPFYMKETREVFRELFGAPNDKKTYMKVLCGLPMYVKFAGSAVVALRRWMDAPELDSGNESIVSNYFDNIFVRHKSFGDPLDSPLSSSDLAVQVVKHKPELEPGGAEQAKKKKKKKKSKSKSCNENSDPSVPLKDSGGACKDSDTVKDSQLAAAKDAVSADLLVGAKSTDSCKLESSKSQTDKSCDKELGKEKRNLDEPVKGGGSDEVKSDVGDGKKEKTSSDGRCDSEKGGAKKTVATETNESTVSGNDGRGEEKQLLLDEPKVKVQANADSAKIEGKTSLSVSESAEKGQGEGPVAMAEDVAVAKDDFLSRKKLHFCGLCGREEVTAKTFKRCQKCRGKSNPKYYCSRECQVRDWKTHKMDHKDDL